MKIKDAKIWKYIFLATLMLAGFVFAQFEDEDDFLLGEKSEVSCIPENMTTVYDSFATKELEQDIRILYSFGTEYYKNKSYKEALPYLWKVFLKGNDKYACNSVRKMADIYFYQGIVDSTLIVCYRGLERFPDEISLHHYAGSLQNKLGKSDCAIPHFEKLVETNPDNVDYLKTLALLLFRNQDERAVEFQKRVVTLKPDDAEESDLLADIMEALLDPEEALKQRKDNYEKNPKNPEYAFEYGQAAVNIGNFDEALKPLGVAIAKEPKVNTFLLRAQAYENLEKYGKAINDYKSALNIDSKNADIMVKIANDYKFKNNFGSAKYWVNKALSVKRGYGLAYITMGEIIEASVPYCQKQRGSSKTTFEDKLVYAEAKKEYKKAMNDSASRSKAKTKIGYLASLLPTKEDKFMNQGKQISSSCYGFLK